MEPENPRNMFRKALDWTRTEGEGDIHNTQVPLRRGAAKLRPTSKLQYRRLSAKNYAL
jgi:hypothetical protein